MEEELSDGEAEEDDDDGTQKRKFPRDRPNVHGAIPGRLFADYLAFIK